MLGCAGSRRVGTGCGMGMTISFRVLPEVRVRAERRYVSNWSKHWTSVGSALPADPEAPDAHKQIVACHGNRPSCSTQVAAVGSICVWQDAIPMSLSFPKTGDSAVISGADPQVCAGPPGPALRQRNQLPSKPGKAAEAAAGVQGGPPTKNAN